MRTTVSIPDRLHDTVASLAHHTGRTFSATLADLIERGLAAPACTAAEPTPAGYYIHPVTGLPVTRGTRIITPEDVARLEDEI